MLNLTPAPIVSESSDIQLVAQSLSGDRDAFGLIVDRYRILVCSLAYSRCGDIARSEDVAQEVFVTAWKKLQDLKEPSKLKSWLCGMTRNILRNTIRAERQVPIDSDALLSLVESRECDEVSPDELTMSDEEQALVWRSLESIPELYREPLILFYRESKSVTQVASVLEISEDAVKQRLSRGRQQLQSKVLNLVEGVLSGSIPRKAFTVGVLAALPVAVPEATAAGVAAATTAKGATVAKAMTLSAIGGALVGLLGAAVGIMSTYRAARSDCERQFVVSSTLKMSTALVLFGVLLVGGIWWVRDAFQVSGVGLYLGLGGFIATYAVWLFWWIWRFNKTQKAIQIEEGTYVAPSVVFSDDGSISDRDILSGYLGSALGMGIGGSALPAQRGDWSSVALLVIACVVVVIVGTWHTKRWPENHRKHYMWAFGVLGAWGMAIANLRLERWLPAIEGQPEAYLMTLLGMNGLFLFIIVGVIAMDWLNRKGG